MAKSVKEIEHVMSVGNQNRKVGRTDMNEHSSRSHAVFILTVECAEVGLHTQQQNVPSVSTILRHMWFGLLDAVGWSRR